MLASPMSALAQDITIPSGTTATTTQVVTADGESVTIEEGGTIDTVASSVRAVEGTASNQTITNRGLIDSGDTGIRSNGDDAGISNSGTINAENFGIRSEGNRASINNSGTINSIGIAIRSDGDHAVITNTGTVNGDSQGTVVQIHGIRLGGAYATMINRGTIIAEEDGIFVEGDHALVINSGSTRGGVAGIGSQGDYATIINAGRAVTGDGSGAIKLAGINDHLILLNGSVLEGIVRFDGIDQSLTVGSGLNLFLNYAGAFSTLSSDSPLVHDAANSRVIAVDPTGFATAGLWLQTIGNVTRNAVTDALAKDTRIGFTDGGRFAYGTDRPTGTGGWAVAYGGAQSLSGSGGVTGARQAYGGVVSGGTLVSDERLYGVFGGGGYSHIETDGDQQTIAVSSAYGGLYASMNHGHWRLDTLLTAGYAYHRSERQVANNGVVGGLETASATYGGLFISPAVTLTRPVNDRTDLSLAGSYGALFLDGYQEAGSAASLAVARRTVQVATLQAKVTRLAVERRMENGILSVETWIGADGAFNLGDNNIDTSVAGLPLEFTSAFADATAIGFAGIGISHRPDGGAWSFEATLEGRLGTHDYREIRATALAARPF
ncbi:MAG: autotransporter domain-containing protein [Alphaproteobacteria bacterium]|nr:autotransporter domain-containing protein [Alphaproteobacteria bacterium]